MGSEDVDTARNESGSLVPDTVANHRCDSGSYSIQGSLASFCGSMELGGSTLFQNARWERCRSTFPVALSCTVHPPTMKSTTCFGPTAPCTFAAALNPGPLLPSKVATTSTTAAGAAMDPAGFRTTTSTGLDGRLSPLPS